MSNNQEMITVSLEDLLWQIHMECEVRTENSNTSKKDLPKLNVEVNTEFFNVEQFN